MNGLKGGVMIDSFDLPANDPAGGVALTLATTLVNPSSVGVALSQIGFQNSFGSTTIGPAASTGPFTLLPKSTIQLPLAGRLIPQTTPLGLEDVSTIFNGPFPSTMSPVCDAQLNLVVGRLHPRPPVAARRSRRLRWTG